MYKGERIFRIEKGQVIQYTKTVRSRILASEFNVQYNKAIEKYRNSSAETPEREAEMSLSRESLDDVNGNVMDVLRNMGELKNHELFDTDLQNNVTENPVLPDTG